MQDIRFSFTFMFLYLSSDRKVTATVKVTYLFLTTDRLQGICTLHVRNVFRMNDFLTTLNRRFFKSLATT